MSKTALNLPKTHVPSGQFLISRRKGAIFHADLGTCVGVALYDRNANVGGLIHLLLPEPPSPENPWQPEMYAATGLPLFIERLCQQGANKANLEASVAGGALMGPISRVDLNLDIGGRTAEIAERLLLQEQIPIRLIEIGGYFSCRLSLNLQTWETEIEPLGISTEPSGAADFDKLDTEHLDNIIKQVRPIPQVVLKVLRMISEQTYRHADVVKEIMQDQVMSAKIIGFCNSVFFGMRTRVDSIDRALFVVGEKWLLQVILTTAVEEFLSQTEEGYSLCKGGLFQHACGTASVAKSLAQLTGKATPDLAYTAGLLHDIGKAVLDQYMHARRPLFYRYVQSGNVDLIEAERKSFGVTHPEVGKQLAIHWSIPETLVEVIAHHHQPEEAVIGPDLTLLVYLTDLIMSRFMVGQELERLNTDALKSSLNRIGLSPEQLPLLIGRLPQAFLDSPWLANQQRQTDAH
jgi:putative nucleotidyltransferase with HDIG domain